MKVKKKMHPTLWSWSWSLSSVSVFSYREKDKFMSLTKHKKILSQVVWTPTCSYILWALPVICCSSPCSCWAALWWPSPRLWLPAIPEEAPTQLAGHQQSGPDKKVTEIQSYSSCIGQGTMSLIDFQWLTINQKTHKVTLMFFYLNFYESIQHRHLVYIPLFTNISLNLLCICKNKCTIFGWLTTDLVSLGFYLSINIYKNIHVNYKKKHWQRLSVFFKIRVSILNLILLGSCCRALEGKIGITLQFVQ